MENDIISAARKWVGTPFKHQGRVMGVGCDCLGLLMGIAKECALTTLKGQPIVDLDQTAYHRVADGALLELSLDTNLSRAQELTLSDLALLEFDSNPQHLGIISDNSYRSFNIIHADMRRGMVVEHSLSNEYQSKIKKIYKLKEDVWLQ